MLVAWVFLPVVLTLLVGEEVEVGVDGVPGKSAAEFAGQAHAKRVHNFINKRRDLRQKHLYARRMMDDLAPSVEEEDGLPPSKEPHYETMVQLKNAELEAMKAEQQVLDMSTMLSQVMGAAEAAAKHLNDVLWPRVAQTSAELEQAKTTSLAASMKVQQVRHELLAQEAAAGAEEDAAAAEEDAAAAAVHAAAAAAKDAAAAAAEEHAAAAAAAKDAAAAAAAEEDAAAAAAAAARAAPGSDKPCPYDAPVLRKAYTAFNGVTIRATDECECEVGYAGGYKWESNISPFGGHAVGSWSGGCRSVACPANSYSHPDCACKRGTFGELRWNRVLGDYEGECRTAECPAHSAHPGATTDCVCSAAFSGDLTWDGRRWRGECTPKPCPANSERLGDMSFGDSDDCHCKIGYTGTPALGQPCTYVRCPPQSVNHPNCECESQMTGVISWSTYTQAYAGVCLKVACPTHAVRSGGNGPCTCLPGFEGVLAYKDMLRVWEGTCTRKSPFSSGYAGGHGYGAGAGGANTGGAYGYGWGSHGGVPGYGAGAGGANASGAYGTYGGGGGTYGGSSYGGGTYGGGTYGGSSYGGGRPPASSAASSEFCRQCERTFATAGQPISVVMTPKQFKLAYHRSAKNFHPDKQLASSDAEKAQAEANFKIANGCFHHTDERGQDQDYLSCCQPTSTLVCRSVS